MAFCEPLYDVIPALDLDPRVLESRVVGIIFVKRCPIIA
jgi:hypothetical protein